MMLSNFYESIASVILRYEILIMFRFHIKRYFSIIGQLHPYLVQNLKRRGQFPLKQFQEESFATISGNQNVFVNSCTGSGKTLAYLIPIMNDLLHKQDRNSQ